VNRPDNEPDFRALFESVPGLYLVLDPELNIVAVSNAYCAATMTKRRNIVGRGLFDVFPDNPDEPDATGATNLRASLARVQACLRPDAMALQKYDIRRPEAEGGGFEIRFWSPLNTPVLGEDGELKWIIHRVEDVTELVQARSDDTQFQELREQHRIVSELRAANRELADKVEENTGLQRDRFLLASIVESSDDAIIAKTLDGIVLSWNAAAEKMLGYTAQEMIGRPVAVLFPPDFLEEEDRILKRLRAGQHIHEYETRRRRKGGADIDVSLTGSPIYDAAGRILGGSTILRDIAERKRTQERLQDLQSELIHLSRWNTMGMMASTIAHELNQPLAAISNYASALKRMIEEKGDDVANEVLDKILKQRLRASQIVERLRNQVAGGDSQRQPEVIDAVVQEAIELVAPITARARVRTVFEVERPLPRAVVDRIQIQQVVTNLMRNAVEAMEGSKARRLQIGLARTADEKFIQIDVADTGAGLAESVTARLFQPFVTTKSTGMGLGLSICRDIVETHGGKLWARPNDLSGTTFSFTLPVESAAGKAA
jgi:two-component system sensor kinase FixL